MEDASIAMLSLLRVVGPGDRECIEVCNSAMERSLPKPISAPTSSSLLLSRGITVLCDSNSVSFSDSTFGIWLSLLSKGFVPATLCEEIFGIVSGGSIAFDLVVIGARLRGAANKRGLSLDSSMGTS